MRQPTSRPQIDMITIGRTVFDQVGHGVAAQHGAAGDRQGPEAVDGLVLEVVGDAPCATPKAVKTMVWAKIPPMRNSR